MILNAYYYLNLYCSFSVVITVVVSVLFFPLMFIFETIKQLWYLCFGRWAILFVIFARTTRLNDVWTTRSEESENIKRNNNKNTNTHTDNNKSHIEIKQQQHQLNNKTICIAVGPEVTHVTTYHLVSVCFRNIVR